MDWSVYLYLLRRCSCLKVDHVATVLMPVRVLVCVGGGALLLTEGTSACHQYFKALKLRRYILLNLTYFLFK